MHQAIARALAATLALAYISTLPHKVQIFLSCSLSVSLASASPGNTLVTISQHLLRANPLHCHLIKLNILTHSEVPHWNVL